VSTNNGTLEAAPGGLHFEPELESSRSLVRFDSMAFGLVSFKE